MIVTLDDRRVEMAVEPDCSLQTLLDRIRATCPDRLIVSVAINGRSLADAELQEALHQPVAADAQVDLHTSEARELVADALRGLALEFGQARRRCGDLARRLTGGESASALRDIGECIGLWQTCHRVLGQCGGLLGNNLVTYQHADQPVQHWFEQVIEKLVEVRQALEAHDLVLLADLVRYELPTLCETWRDLLNDLAAQVQPVGAAEQQEV